MIPTDFIFLFIIRVSFFMIRNDPSPIIFYFYFFIRSELVRVDPSWSDPDWRSELIRSDFYTCLKLKFEDCLEIRGKTSHFCIHNFCCYNRLVWKVFHHQMKHLEVRQKNPLRFVFLTLFSVFHLVIKHSVSCFIYYL